MFELSVWLIVTFYSPDTPHGKTILEQQYTSEPAMAVTQCTEDALPWLAKAAETSRGEWMIDVACQVRHEEAEPARGRE